MASLTPEFRGMPGQNPIHLTIKCWGRPITQYRYAIIGPDNGSIEKFEMNRKNDNWDSVGQHFEGPIISCYAELIGIAAEVREADRPEFNVGDIIFYLLGENYPRGKIFRLGNHPETGFPAAEIKFLEDLENRQEFEWIELDYIDLVTEEDEDDDDEGRGIDVTAAMMTGML